MVTSIVNELCEEHDITLVAGEGDGKMLDDVDDRVHKIRYPHLLRAVSPYHDMRTLFFIWNLQRKLRPDIIHLHSSKAGLLGRLILPRRKIIYTVHGFDSIRVAFRNLLFIERFMQKRCAAIVGVSQYDTNNLHGEGISNNISLVYNGIKITSEDRQLPIDIPETYKKTVMCIARVSMPKRLDIFLDCARRLPQYAFVWIGNLMPMHGMPENVFFAGNLPNAAAYCHKADLFMLPSNYEGLPIVLLEAMSKGKPIVASKVGGVPEIVINGKNGYVLPNDVDAFVEKIDYILSNEEVSRHFSKFSLKMVEKHFTAKKMAENYMRLYKEIYKKNH